MPVPENGPYVPVIFMRYFMGLKDVTEVTVSAGCCAENGERRNFSAKWEDRKGLQQFSLRGQGALQG
jgi:hypothetical protein